MFWLGFVVGLFSGMFVTMVVLSLCAAAARGDKRVYGELGGETTLTPDPSPLAPSAREGKVNADPER